MNGKILVDTSVAVPLVVADHDQHEAISEHVSGAHLGLSGHAAFETYSVLTRLPSPLRRNPRTVNKILAASFPGSVFLSPERAAALLRELPGSNISGGAVYDALVGAAAVEAGLRLLSSDRRAVDTYRLLDVDVELLS